MEHGQCFLKIERMDYKVDLYMLMGEKDIEIFNFALL